MAPANDNAPPIQRLVPIVGEIGAGGRVVFYRPLPAPARPRP